MAYECRVERDSITPAGRRLTSFVIAFPRVVLAEFATHRLNHDTWGYEETTWCERTTDTSVSKNSGSSRAIPLARMIQRVVDDPYVPERFSKNGVGMQGSGWLEGRDHKLAEYQWLDARDNAVRAVCMMLSQEDIELLCDKLTSRWARSLVFEQRCGYARPSVSVHKQDVNRLLEPWAWVTQIVTSSCWDNFFALRCDAAAAPAFQKIARMMYLARRKSTPRMLDYGQWHLPFVPEEEAAAFHWQPPAIPCPDVPDLLKFSAARCAWVSYENADRKGTPEQMQKTYSRLMGAIPRHFSPVEHQATPMPESWGSWWPHLVSNLRGWLQGRKLIHQECITAYVPTDQEIASWGLGE